MSTYMSSSWRMCNSFMTIVNAAVITAPLKYDLWRWCRKCLAASSWASCCGQQSSRKDDSRFNGSSAEKKEPNSGHSLGNTGRTTFHRFGWQLLPDWYGFEWKIDAEHRTQCKQLGRGRRGQPQSIPFRDKPGIRLLDEASRWHFQCICGLGGFVYVAQLKELLPPDLPSLPSHQCWWDDVRWHVKSGAHSTAFKVA